MGGTLVPETTRITLLGVKVETKLAFGDHLRSAATRARQRLGVLNRAAHITPAGRTTVYKAFVRPVMEYAPLVWMGAAQSHLQRLNNVQRHALHAISPGAHLPSSAIRRTVSSLACLFKLHYLSGPPQLLSVLPPHHITSANPRTRSEHSNVSGHDHQLQHQLPASAPLALKRSFPHCSISDWNSLPVALLSQPPHSKIMQSFKTNVYRHLRSTNWLWAVDSL
ncbi:uncharacterized protein LOC135826588 [Sycon ciliatum]|uniref:uncharacterized protein LOC135826588 n=1 Tax=Sycon ciliatum TaxID=27933 RepID=UPI0031F5F6CE